MDNERDTQPERRTSTVSSSSNLHRPGTVRARSRKQSLVTPNSAKSLVSFPSLSPEASPALYANGSFNLSPVARTGSIPHTPRKDSTGPPSIVQSLIQRSASARGRTALFDDSPKGTGQEIPGALHHASDDHIQHRIARTGAVALVRQLAEDLAQRDAEMTGLRRRAEERERELKRMLREVEVSNLDIETRLHRVGSLIEKPVRARDLTIKTGRRPTGGRSRTTSITDGIDQMMGEAMKDDVGVNTEPDEAYMDSLNGQDRHATIKAGNAGQRDVDRASTSSSVESHGLRASTVRGWKGYLWSGNNTSKMTSRTSSIMSDYNENAEAVMKVQTPSGANGRRKALDDDLFSPLKHASTTESNSNAETQSRKSSSSVTSWTMKLFAGNPQASRDPISNTARGRSATTGSGAPKNSRGASTASAQTPSSARAALLRVNSMAPENRTPRKFAPPPPIPTNATKATPQSASIQLPNSPTSVTSAANLGPVEMDTILPPDSRPPTDQTYNNTSTEFLTDRFGFIYDQRRRKREAEMLKNVKHKHKRSSGVESLTNDRASTHSRTDSIRRPDTPASTDDKTEEKPAKRWQDYLKKATFPTELLSHTPSAKPSTTVITAETPTPLKRSPTFESVRGSLSSTTINPSPSASPITASNAEISKPLLSASDAQPSETSTSEAEPVKLLLAQLTEIHDTLQHDRTVKWNEFLRKIRASRQKAGDTAAPNTKQPTDMPEVSLTDGEMIGVANLGKKGKVGRAKWKEFTQLVLTGIPVAYRAKIWAECSGASALRVPGYYDDLVQNGIDDPETLTQITMDIHRTMTDNVFFRTGPGVPKLREVLLAYARRNPQLGYCQGMNLVTASLLLIMPTAEDAFWLLATIVETILPPGYYSATLLASRADTLVLRHYVAVLLPKLSAHLDSLGIELEALTFQWFLSVFTACLSAEALFRVWDVVLCLGDGSTFLFQVALALLKLNEGRLVGEETAGGVYDCLGGVSDHEVGIDGLIRGSEALKGEVRREDVMDLRVSALVEEEKLMHGDRQNSIEEGNESGELEVQVPMPVQD